MSRFAKSLIAGAGTLLITTGAHAAAISYVGGTYTQNFDSMPNTPENTALDTVDGPGGGGYVQEVTVLDWQAFTELDPGVEDGPTGFDRMRIGPGTATTGSIWSYGSTGSTDRALSGLGSNTTGGERYGTRFQNDTQFTIDSFTLSYVGEQWRDGGTTTTGSIAQTVDFEYSLNATAVNDAAATWVAVDSLDFTSPVFGATSGTAKDGNLAPNRTAISDTVAISLAAGGTLWIRWVDPNHAGNDHGLGIDDLNFSATTVIPEPSGLSLLGLGGLGLLARRRSR